MPARPVIPAELYGLWTSTRVQRAVVRQLLIERTTEFWDMFPRRRRRVMPVIVYGRNSTWFEPEPVPHMQPADRLGLVLRWRVSGVYATKKAEAGQGVPSGEPGKTLHQMWEYEYPMRRGAEPPSRGVLAGGKITDPVDVENYVYAWRKINDLYDHYCFISSWFASTVHAANQLEAQTNAHRESMELHRRVDAWMEMHGTTMAVPVGE